MSLKRWLVFILLVPGCLPPPPLADYITQPPPDNVRAELASGRIAISWQAPATRNNPIIAYQIYVAQKSLVYAAVRELPVPVAVVPAAQTAVSLPHPGWHGEIFLHVRSLNQKGQLSLPSLPELHLDLP